MMNDAVTLAMKANVMKTKAHPEPELALACLQA
jgi:hypothetical protein